MKKLLYIDACVRKEMSRTRKIAKAFLENISGYEIKELYLEEENLKPLTGDFFFSRQELLDKNQLDHPRFDYAHEFANADLIVCALPFWDLGFPALFKLYIENISVDGITFSSTEKGLLGLSKADKLIYITTRGGIYSDDSFEVGTRCLESYCQFFGVNNLETIVAQGLDIQGYDGQKELDQAIIKAKDLAKQLSI